MPAAAEPKYDTGASDTEIKIGQTSAYSGPVSAWSVGAKVQVAYMRMLNEKGGINGRKIDLISLDDSYSPPKTVEQTRRLVESDGVLFMFGSLGAASNTAVHKYLNSRKVPQLFPSSGAAKWSDPEHFPWTMGWMPSFAKEGFLYGKYVLANKPDAKIAIFFQNDDYGKDYVEGFERALGPEASKLIVIRTNYQAADPTVESQIVSMKASGANVLLDASSPKFAAQAIKRMGEIGWTPMHLLASPSAQIDTVFRPAGLEASKGIISATFLKDPASPALKADQGVKDYLSFMAKYVAEIDPQSQAAVWAYASAETIVHVLKQCGDDLTRENVMRQAANLKDIQISMIYPGIKINTSPTDYEPVEDALLQEFDGSIMRLLDSPAR
ncbi:MAG TPA: ABC transporter substrate-binding protein [Bradyrhizobium sp.]|nr:ABC transporter substrate-binding protein [Bradyrhizobium sp.]